MSLVVTGALAQRRRLLLKASTAPPSSSLESQPPFAKQQADGFGLRLVVSKTPEPRVNVELSREKHKKATGVGEFNQIRAPQLTNKTISVKKMSLMTRIQKTLV